MNKAVYHHNEGKKPRITFKDAKNMPCEISQGAFFDGPILTISRVSGWPTTLTQESAGQMAKILAHFAKTGKIPNDPTI